MSQHRLFELRHTIGAFALVALLSAPTFAGDGPLAAAAFDKEITAEMKGADVTEVFQRLSDAIGVSFALDFRKEDDLKVSFKATNLTARALLHSLGDAYGLSYSTSDNGDVRVRRDGPPPPSL